jgi:hypothetical protein
LSVVNAHAQGAVEQYNLLQLRESDFGKTIHIPRPNNVVNNVYIDTLGWYAFRLPQGAVVTPDPTGALIEWRENNQRVACAVLRSPDEAGVQRGADFAVLQETLSELFTPDFERNILDPAWTITKREIVEIRASLDNPRTQKIAFWHILNGARPMAMGMAMGTKGSIIMTCVGKDSQSLADIARTRLRLAQRFATN